MKNSSMKWHGISDLLKVVTKDRVLDNVVKKEYVQFEQNDSNKGLISFKCPDCGGSFGLDGKVINDLGECNYLVSFSCPYCTKSHSIK